MAESSTSGAHEGDGSNNGAVIAESSTSGEHEGDGNNNGADEDNHSTESVSRAASGNSHSKIPALTDNNFV